MRMEPMLIRQSINPLMVEPVYVTPAGLAKAEAELRHLQDKIRKLLVSIADERAFPDPLAPGDVHSAIRHDLLTIEAQIAARVAFLGRAQVIPASRRGRTVGIASAVTVADRATGQLSTYMLVGPLNSDPAAGRISYLSPVGQALVGRRVGDAVDVRVPAGVVRLRITQVHADADRGDEPAVRSRKLRRPVNARSRGKLRRAS